MTSDVAELSRFDSIKKSVVSALGIALCLFTLFEVNYNTLQPQSSLAIFVGLGLVLCYLTFPVAKCCANHPVSKSVDVILAVLSALTCLYVVVQTEPIFEWTWADGFSLGNRAGSETGLDYLVGVVGVLLVLESTRRSIGLIVPLLALAFMAHSFYCHLSLEQDLPMLPDWMLPHAGQNTKDLVSTTFLQSLGVFGAAASVMFKYVFLFVVFG